MENTENKLYWWLVGAASFKCFFANEDTCLIGRYSEWTGL